MTSGVIILKECGRRTDIGIFKVGMSGTNCFTGIQEALFVFQKVKSSLRAFIHRSGFCEIKM